MRFAELTASYGPDRLEDTRPAMSPCEAKKADKASGQRLAVPGNGKTSTEP
ncbi:MULTISPECIES: hypothetical protein [Pseudomonadaceae]|uniref:hypothetical protein n=1 Tax=Pseudomonadaceae TaxID=135621 RepID=UPI0013F6495E|nr:MULTISPECIES: hypothetical protein [Pseudomonas]